MKYPQLNRVVATSLVLFAGSLNALSRDDISDKSKPVWTDFTATLVYQFRVNIPFGQLNRYLCLFNKTEYQRFANLQKTDEVPAHAYLTRVDQTECGISNDENAHLVRATQATAESAVAVEYWNGAMASDNNVYVLRAEVSEEASEANPFGIMTLDSEAYGKDNPSKMLLRWRSESSRLDDDTVQYKVVEWLDSYVVDQSRPVGFSEEYYAVNILYSEGDSGYGTIINKFFRPDLSQAGRYPDGIPAQSGATNIAFNKDFIKYEQYFDSYYFGTQQASKVQIASNCIARSNPWGYGIYDANGDRNTETFDAIYEDAEQNTIAVTVNGFQLSPPQACRSLLDGSTLDVPANSAECPVQAVTGPSTLPIVDIPDLAVITASGGAKYIVRQLKPRIVYPEVDMENCADLTVQDTLAVENHTFFEGHSLDAELPTAGAVLVNDFADDPGRDPNYAGVSYLPLEDADEDGVLNYQDAFPEDPARSADADFDGIDDADDASSDRYVFDHSEFLAPDAIEYLTPSMR
ncbi:MAG: hypothetical protein VW867_08570 [Gammaproteobacteria bacterium]